MFEERASMFEVPKPKVREYTEEERHAIEWWPGQTRAEKVARLERTHAIDVARYNEAIANYAESEPAFAAHMERLKAGGAVALEAWRRYHEEAAAQEEATRMATLVGAAA